MRSSLREVNTKAAFDACFLISCALLLFVLFKFMLHIFQAFGSGGHFSYLISTAREFALPSFLVLVSSFSLMLIQKINFQIYDILAIVYNDIKYSRSYAFFFKTARFFGILFFIFSSFMFIEYLLNNAILFIVGVLIAAILFAQFAKISGWHD